MTTEARIGYGTLFYSDDGDSPGQWPLIAEVTSITPPGLSRDTVDATHMQSPEKWREFIAGLKDGGECQIEFNLVPGGATMEAMVAEFDSDEFTTRRVVFPDGTLWEFDAACTNFEQEASLDDKMAGTGTFKITGKPTLTQV